MNDERRKHDKEAGIAARQVAEQLASIQAANRRNQIGKSAAIAGLSLLVIGLIGGLALLSILLYRDARIESLAPPNVKESAAFQLVVPYDPGVRVDTDSYTYSNGLVSYNVVTDTTVYAINQQALPSSFDILDFANGQGLETPTQYRTRLGNALFGSLNGNDIIIFEGENVLMTAVARSNTNLQDRQLLVDTLVELN